ncbi:hypothetical protein FRACA_130017 [Frankia canadensis]|uniref:Uncharacterized protein n=1 Tax=Frankia canadensis TaxID=1836972 RepID=A0A2I2KKK7_9ACTN|nr:hypothetical protein FRACA_130017 [Frankia canadensis]SOU53483.1 hypothetical protein FRACA_130017 [Frankia canadensis]
MCGGRRRCARNTTRRARFVPMQLARRVARLPERCHDRATTRTWARPGRARDAARQQSHPGRGPPSATVAANTTPGFHPPGGPTSRVHRVTGPATPAMGPRRSGGVAARPATTVTRRPSARHVPTHTPARTRDAEPSCLVTGTPVPAPSCPAAWHNEFHIGSANTSLTEVTSGDRRRGVRRRAPGDGAADPARRPAQLPCRRASACGPPGTRDHAGLPVTPPARTETDDGCPAHAATVEEDEVNGVTTTPTPAAAPAAPRTGGRAVTPRRSRRAVAPAGDGRSA